MSKLTKQFMESEIQVSVTGQGFYRDDEVPGFAIRVTRKCKSWILEKCFDGANRRITIGKGSEMFLDSAKRQACIMLGDIAKGNDPKTGKHINTSPFALSQGIKYALVNVVLAVKNGSATGARNGVVLRKY